MAYTHQHTRWRRFFSVATIAKIGSSGVCISIPDLDFLFYTSHTRYKTKLQTIKIRKMTLDKELPFLLLIVSVNLTDLHSTNQNHGEIKTASFCFHYSINIISQKNKITLLIVSIDPQKDKQILDYVRKPYELHGFMRLGIRPLWTMFR